MPPARSATSAARSATSVARSGSTAGPGSTARARAAARASARAAQREASSREASARDASPRPARPRHVPLRSAATRVRWERLGRIALLVVLAAVVAVYAEHAVSYLSTRAQNARQQAIVRSLEIRHAQLVRREHTLKESTTIIRRARQLGMTRTGEQPYVATGQSGR